MKTNVLVNGKPEFAAIANAVLLERFPFEAKRGGGTTPTSFKHIEQTDFGSGQNIRPLPPLPDDRVTRAFSIAATLLSAIVALPRETYAGQWSTFRDPTEAAFTIDVPSGWQVSGGLKRRSVNQPHPLLAVVSPDGLARILFGDPSAIAYSELTNSMRGLGFREGQSYTPKGEPEIIRNYQTGSSGPRPSPGESSSRTAAMASK
jgi:hypothetical protein